MEIGNQNFYTRLDFKEKLGQGAFGTVHRVIFKTPYKGYKEAAAKNVHRLKREEVDIMCQLDHPNIVKFIGLYSNGPVNIIFLEYAQNGSLYDYLVDHNRPLSDSLRRQWAKEAALAIQYLHTCKFLQRDIKPSNCLLFEDTSLKLCDFGLAREIDHAYLLSSEKGTYQYMAPEIINTNDNGQATFSVYTDIYTYGMLLLAIYTRQTPFSGMIHAYVIYHVGSGKLQPEIPEYVPQGLRDVMRKCWDVDPTRRPTVDSILGDINQEVIQDGDRKLKWHLQKRIQKTFASKIAHRPNGDIVTAFKDQVHLLDPDGNVKRSLALPHKADTWSNGIIALCSSLQGHVYIVGYRSHLITVFSQSCIYLNTFSILSKSEDPNTTVLTHDATVDKDGNLLVIDNKRSVITVHTCPSGEITRQIRLKVRRQVVKATVNSKKHILLHQRPHNSAYSRVAAIDYSGNELYSFIPKIDVDVGKEWIWPSGIVCDSDDNIFVTLYVVGSGGKQMMKVNTGHIHKYSATGAFLQCIDSNLFLPTDLSLSQDETSIAVANSSSILIYNLK